MGDPSSDTTGDEVDTQTYSIVTDDFLRLKYQIAALEAEARVIDTYSSRPYPSAILQTAWDVKDSLDKIKPTPVVLTPEPSVSGDNPTEIGRSTPVSSKNPIVSDAVTQSTPETSVSGDSPAEPKRLAPFVCEYLIMGGSIVALFELLDFFKELKAKGDIVAGVYGLSDDFDVNDPMFDEYVSKISMAVSEDPDLIYSFPTCARHLVIDLFTYNVQTAAMKELKEKFSKWIAENEQEYEEEEGEN